jgi:hypothetical protein
VGKRVPRPRCVFIQVDPIEVVAADGPDIIDDHAVARLTNRDEEQVRGLDRLNQVPLWSVTGEIPSMDALFPAMGEVSRYVLVGLG